MVQIMFQHAIINQIVLQDLILVLTLRWYECDSIWSATECNGVQHLTKCADQQQYTPDWLLPGGGLISDFTLTWTGSSFLCFPFCNIKRGNFTLNICKTEKKTCLHSGCDLTWHSIHLT